MLSSHKLPVRLRSLFRKDRVEQELADELRFQLERLMREKVGQGTTPHEARYAARRELGGVEQIKEECRDMRRANYIENFLQDLRYGFRQLRHNPGFTAVAVLTLALGIGANTAIFTVVDTVLLHPLPYPDSDRIVNILRKDGDGDSIPMFVYWRQNNPGFGDLAGYDGGANAINMSGADRPELVQALKVSLNYFHLFGANPILGRTFTAEEDQPAGPQALVMSYSLWQRRFGGDPAILGKTINLGGAPYTVVGVLTPHFQPYPSTDVWIPLQADAASTDQAHLFMVSGRLPKEVTLAQANSQMAVVGQHYMQTHPEDIGNDGNLEVVPLQQKMTGNVRPALLILLGAVALVLLIACANVANLLLARAAGRQKEIAVRTAIGAGRSRIVRQVLAESILLAFAGGVLGLALASWGVRALLALVPGDLPRVQEMASVPALNPWVAGFTLLLSALTGVLFGVLPAVHLAHTDLASSLKEGTGRTGAGLKQNRTQRTLVAAEVAIAMILLCGAVLLIRSFAELHRIDPGFDPHNLLTVTVSLDGPKYSDASVVDRLARQITERLEHIPGVKGATVTSGLPLGQNMDMIFDIPGRPPLKGCQFTGDVLWPFVSAHYFQALRVPLLAGRLLREREPPHTVVINQALADRFWPHQNPVGQSMQIGAHLGPQLDQGLVQVVGVVGNVRDRLDWAFPPIMYQTQSQVPDAAMKLVNGQMPAGIIVRTRPGVAPLNVSGSVQQVLLSLQLPAAKVQTMEQTMLDSTAQTNFNLLLLTIFAGMALLLAGVGIFGVMSYTVRLRTREIGIRLALGASNGHVFRLLVGQGAVLTVIGVGIGVAGALGLTRFLSSLLYGVKPTDPLTFVIVALVLAVVALLACYLPARRATKLDPMMALRYE
jgi:putative ABC transport system permease protein